jgi:hypothetical protein
MRFGCCGGDPGGGPVPAPARRPVEWISAASGPAGAGAGLGLSATAGRPAVQCISAAPAQDAAFPPPGGGQGPLRGGISVAPGGNFTAAAPGGGFPAGPGGGFGEAPRAPTQEQKVCLTFPTIREDVEKGAAAIKAAGVRKATREEVCPLFKVFAAKEGKMVAFLSNNQKLCGIPPNVISQVKTNHANTIRIRNNVCSAAPTAAGPTLSDALGGPIIADDQTAKLPNRGTFDTLTGNALQK